jgi:hypothetical protein
MTKTERVSGFLVSAAFLLAGILVTSYLVRSLHELPGWFTALVLMLEAPMVVSAVRYMAKCLERSSHAELAGKPGS